MSMERANPETASRMLPMRRRRIFLSRGDPQCSASCDMQHGVGHRGAAFDSSARAASARGSAAADGDGASHNQVPIHGPSRHGAGGGMGRRLRDVDVEATPAGAGVAASHPWVFAPPPRPYCSDKSARVVLPLSLMPLASSFGATTKSRDESIFLLIH